MGGIIAILFLAIGGWILYRGGASLGGGGGSVKCAGCVHCGRLDRDGVLCRFGRRETFKNHVHIANCIDFKAR